MQYLVLLPTVPELANRPAISAGRTRDSKELIVVPIARLGRPHYAPISPVPMQHLVKNGHGITSNLVPGRPAVASRNTRHVTKVPGSEAERIMDGVWNMR